MKKLLLSVLSLCVVTGMMAAVPFKVTTIENGEFAQGTTWYTMGIGEGAKLIKELTDEETIEIAKKFKFDGKVVTYNEICNKKIDDIADAYFLCQYGLNMNA